MGAGTTNGDSFELGCDLIHGFGECGATCCSRSIPRSSNERLQQLDEGDRVIVSEPLTDLAGAWLEVPESTAVSCLPWPSPAEPRRGLP
jgi:hypothetical protein